MDWVYELPMDNMQCVHIITQQKYTVDQSLTPENTEKGKLKT